MQNCDAETFKYDVIARLPTLVSYNVTTITEEERERAERDFVRRFGQIEEVLRPQRLGPHQIPLFLLFPIHFIATLGVYAIDVWLPNE